MANLELGIVDAPPCERGSTALIIHGLALANFKEPTIIQGYVDYHPSVRNVIDVAHMAALVEHDFMHKGAAGPLLGMWATQLCGAHGTQSRTNLQLEYIGGWYFPTLPAAHTPNVSVAVEEPYRTPAWRATARRLGRRGKVARFSSPVEGITLPRPPHEQDLGEVYEAALLTTVGSQQIYGFLHHPAGEHKGSLEHVVSPARIGKRRRDDVGKFLDFMRTVSPVASQV